MILLSRVRLMTATFACVFALAQAGCSDDGGTSVGDALPGVDGAKGGAGGSGSTTDGGTGTSSLADGSAAPTVVLSDSQVAGVMIEVNDSQATIGNMATGKAQAAGVKALAMQIVTDHLMAYQRMAMLLQKLGLTASPSEIRQMLNTTGVMTLNQLSSRSGAAFDTAYVTVQVDLNQQVLRLLDEVLIPNAQNAELKAELAVSRTAVAKNLAAARALAMSAGGGTTPDAAAGN